jgi:glycosyltransferase involved in cell wall biosynthesis
MTNNKLISVIISSYNAEELIVDSIDSILKQTYKNLEILVIDDASDDNSFEILEDISKRKHNVKIYKNNKNVGLTKSLNFLISESTGNFIARHDIDDISHPLRFERQISLLEKLNLDFCTTRAIIKDTGQLIPRFSHLLPNKLTIKYKNPFIHGTLMIKKEVMTQIGSYDENFYYAQDYKLFTTLLKENYRHKNIRSPLYTLNMTDNISSIKKNQQKYYFECVKKNIVPKEFI